MESTIVDHFQVIFLQLETWILKCLSRHVDVQKETVLVARLERSTGGSSRSEPLMLSGGKWKSGNYCQCSEQHSRFFTLAQREAPTSRPNSEV